MSMTARGLQTNDTTRIHAFDDFAQTEGSLSGKTLPVGGTWSGAGDSDDFKVISSSHRLTRTAVSDTAGKGRFALAGSSEYVGVQVSIRVIKTNTGGCLARYVDTNNYLLAAFTGANIFVIKTIAGAPTYLYTAPLVQQEASFSLLANELGNWILKINGNVSATGSDSVLAPGGVLEKGKVGIYDERSSASASTREYDDFSAIEVPPAGVVCYSGKAIEFNSQGVLREDEAGEHWGQPDLPRGANFYLEPEGDNGTINRLVTRMRRNDVVTEADANVTDKHAIEVKVRERFLVPR